MLADARSPCSGLQQPLTLLCGQMLAPPHSLQWIRLLLMMMICVWAVYYKQMIRPLPCSGILNLHYILNFHEPGLLDARAVEGAKGLRGYVQGKPLTSFPLAGAREYRESPHSTSTVHSRAEPGQLNGAVGFAFR